MGYAISFGLLWGITELAVGLSLASMCAAGVVGSLLTGLSFFFLSASWHSSQKYWAVMLTLGGVMSLKIAGAFLLPLPLGQSAVLHPLFAFISQFLIFNLFAWIVQQVGTLRWWYALIAGGMAGWLAAHVFPLVRFFTGIAACQTVGSHLPLSVYYDYIAVIIGAVAWPIGREIGLWLQTPAARQVMESKWLPAIINVAAMIIFFSLIRHGN